MASRLSRRQGVVCFEERNTVKVKFSREDLLSALQAVEQLVGKVTKPVLRCAKVKFPSGRPATVIASNGEVHVWQDVPVLEVHRLSEILLPVSPLCKMLRFLAGDAVTISQDNKGNLTISDETNSYKIQTEDVSLWPDVVLQAEPPVAVIPACQFRTMMRRTLFCVDTESTRYALGGVALSVGDKGLQAVATDTRRISVCVRPADRRGKPTKAVAVVPGQAVALILRAIDDTPADLEVWWDDKAATFSLAERITIRSRLVEGLFPKWEDVLPQEPPAWKTVAAVEVIKRLTSAASVVSDAESRGADFAFERPNLLTVSCESSQGVSRFVEHTGEHETVNYPQETLTTSLDPAYVAQYLQTLPGEASVRIELIDSESGVVFVPVDSSVYDRYMVMPLSRDR